MKKIIKKYKIMYTKVQNDHISYHETMLENKKDYKLLKKQLISLREISDICCVIDIKKCP